MGVDGHTASLFPGTAVLHDQSRLVAAYHVRSLNAWRVTLTVPTLNAAANVIFLVAGSEKADTVKSVLEGPEIPGQLPAQLVKPENGNLIWLLDEAAASRLTSVKY
jgi:6-phosphogluconolactonase